MKNKTLKFLAKNKILIGILITIIVGIIFGFGVYKFTQSKTNNELASITPEVAGVVDTEKDIVIEPTTSPTPTASSSSKPSTTPKPSSSSTATPKPSSASNPPSTPKPSSTATPQPTIASTPTPTPTPSAPQTSGQAYTVKLLNIFFIPSGVNPIYQPSGLTNQVIPTMKDVSHNSVNYQVVDTQTVARSTTKRGDGRMDYNALLSEFNVCSRLNSGEIDEVWVWVNGGDGAGWEWIISGNINYPEQMTNCGKNLIVMGFDYTRTYELALHSLGHRMEFLANSRNSGEYNSWKSQCGNVHFPPNGVSDYDYGNQTNVQSSCTGQTQTVNCSTWSCSQEGYMKWWFGYIPSNWWGAFLGR